MNQKLALLGFIVLFIGLGLNYRTSVSFGPLDPTDSFFIELLISCGDGQLHSAPG